MPRPPGPGCPLGPGLRGGGCPEEVPGRALGRVTATGGRPEPLAHAEGSLLAPAVYYEGLQDKLAQIRDARGALSALREEHREKLRRAAEEAERQRQIQLAQKLEIMRQKKQVRWRWRWRWRQPRGVGAAGLTLPGPQEYLEVQRQLAIQRLQEQEKERQLRLEQQKQTIQMRAQMPAFSLPYAQVPKPTPRLRPPWTPGTGDHPDGRFSVPSSRPCPRLAACCTSPPAQPASRAPSARRARWRAPPCTPCT